MTTADHALSLTDLRAEIDQVDQELVALLARRRDICRRVADAKQQGGIPMMDESRVLAVRERAAVQGESLGLDRAYVTRLYTVIIDHACELEVAVLGEEGGLVTPVAPAGEAAVFQRVSRRLDHAAIAVHDLEAAVAYFRDRIGFVEVERRNTQGERTGMLSAVMRAGDVQFVLCQGTSDESNVSRYIEHYGSGVQHVAIEVSDVAALVADLNARGCDMITGVISGPGLDQSFTLREPNSGMQIEFIARTGNDGFHEQNVQELFKAMESSDAY